MIDVIGKCDIVVLEGLVAWTDTARKERRVVHAVGDGHFIVDGRTIDRQKMMASRMPPGL